MNYITVTDFLTDAQINEVIKLKTAKLIYEYVILPNIDEINRKLNQENDAMYLAYCCEHIINCAHSHCSN
jgi:hypothetical protein